MQTVKLQAANLPRALPPRIALRGCPSRLGFSLLLDPKTLNHLRDKQVLPRRARPVSVAPVLAPLQVDQGWKGLLDLPVSCICVMRLVINRKPSALICPGTLAALSPECSCLPLSPAEEDPSFLQIKYTIMSRTAQDPGKPGCLSSLVHFS